MYFVTFMHVVEAARHQRENEGRLQHGKKTFKVHLDGYNFMAFFKGDEKQGPRDVIYYFDQGGNLNALRWNDWKLSFATSKGNIATGTREVSAWALITNLRMDPYERGLEEGGGAIDFLARNIWLLVPVQGKIKEFFADFNQFPYQEGNSLNAADAKAAGSPAATEGTGELCPALMRGTRNSW
jgi:hypothetical protein